ncbi:TetR/AcrR family transcriptional regulator [Pelagerythrobacter marinus]|jgi:AcrR family transcriptional regulator|uniref:TetR family transcriptional regulator n=1 Tax=Pelagerythrobacter marinus TaxID=538382 RepID=A0ABW9UWB3_9SPHN|nr:TetR family transcriptional regulator [Pelagerythrobacter marinus]MEC9067044.1 helix-turn-helix domain-containing protein [Pseudomonadota bacterium]MXO67622.1 TetR family transcriptional regulator [Pelagerythrobacter marinus]WPZ07688.1 helix-turn-helix domain-containing protein [Pelagerythrobacter marinus]
MASRKRLTPEESRRSALEAARALLIETGPQSVTLKAVAGRIGRTHANLLHHFGSAAGLQKELARHLAETVCESIKDAVRASRAGLGSPREVVDLAFDAFDKEGAGALASWMILTGNEDALAPVVETIHLLVDEIAPEEAGPHENVARVHEDTLALVLMAMGDALIGSALTRSLKLPETAARDRAERMLLSSIEAVSQPD